MFQLKKGVPQNNSRTDKKLPKGLCSLKNLKILSPNLHKSTIRNNFNVTKVKSWSRRV